MTQADLLLKDPPPYKFSPLHISGLQIWLAADRITGLADGDPVGTWSDLSGNGNDVTQATASKKPTWKVNIINGKPVVRFDGVDDYIGNVAHIISYKSPFSYFAVYYTTSNSRQAPLGNASSSGDGGFFHDVNFTTSDEWRLRLGSEGVGGSSDEMNSAHIASILVDNTAQSLFYNGASEATGSQDLSLLPVDDVAGIGVGGVGSSGVLPFAGDVAEWILYNVALVASARKRVERYLGKKYAIVVN